MPVDRLSVQRLQSALLRRGFGDRVETYPPEWPDGSDDVARQGPPQMFRSARILVREAYRDRVSRLLGQFYETDEGFESDEPDPVPGVTVLAVPEVQRTYAALQAIRARFGPHVAAVDNVVSVTGLPSPGSRCPAAEPEVAPEHARPWPPQSSGAPDGAGIRVAVIDTGLLKDAPHEHAWLDGVTGETEPDTVDGLIPAYTGHGTFIAGVVRAVAPRARVHVLRTLEVCGAAFETELVRRLQDVLATGVDVISLSAGAYPGSDNDLLALRQFVEVVLPRHKGVVLVSAAGNDSVTDLFLPAGLPGVVAVGALSVRSDDRAWFSNFGGWVDVYAIGEDHVNAYATGKYAYNESSRPAAEFAGMARWSGTSFSTPLVAGLIAARMSATGENGVTAAQRLVEFGQTQAIPGVGAILRPGDALRPGT